LSNPWSDQKVIFVEIGTMRQYLFPFFLLLNVAGAAQTPVYLTQLGGSSMDLGFGVAIGPNNEHYFTGHVTAPADLDLSGPNGAVNSSGTYDAFVTKRSSDGTLQWGFTVGGPQGDEGLALDVAGNGDVIVAGTFYQWADMDPGPALVEIEGNGSNPSAVNTFVARYTDQGQFVWAVQLSGDPASCYLHKMVLDADDNIYMTGRYIGTVDFDPSITEEFGLSYLGNNEDAFVCKLDSNGAFLWAKRIGGTATVWGEDIDVNALGEVLVGGWHMNGTCDLDPGPGSEAHTNPNGMRSGWSVKLDTDGNYLWSADIAGNDVCSVYAVMFDENGTAYLGGQFRGTYDMDPGAGTDSVASPGDLDGYIMTLHGTSGERTRFVPFDGWTTQGVGQFAYGGNGTFCFSGEDSAAEDFDLGPGVASFGTYVSNYTCRYDTAFAFMGVYGIPSGAGSHEQDMVVDQDGNVVSIGYFNDSGDMDPSTNDLILSTLGLFDVYISCIGDFPTGVIHTPPSSSGISISPNPSTGVFRVSVDPPHALITILDASGRLVQRFNANGPSIDLDLSDLAPGVYCLHLNDGGTRTARFVIERP
jgi:hypothetical protein